MKCMKIYENNGNEKTELKLQKKYTLSDNWNAYDPFWEVFFFAGGPFFKQPGFLAPAFAFGCGFFLAAAVALGCSLIGRMYSYIDCFQTINTWKSSADASWNKIEYSLRSIEQWREKTWIYARDITRCYFLEKAMKSMHVRLNIAEKQRRQGPPAAADEAWQAPPESRKESTISLHASDIVRRVVSGNCWIYVFLRECKSQVVQREDLTAKWFNLISSTWSNFY